jgi:hypothetical protein
MEETLHLSVVTLEDHQNQVFDLVGDLIAVAQDVCQSLLRTVLPSRSIFQLVARLVSDTSQTYL